MSYIKQINKNSKKLNKHQIHEYGTAEGGFEYWLWCRQNNKTTVNLDLVVEQYALLGWEY